MIEPELKELLQKNLEASQESLHILKKMRRAQVWGGVATFFKWVLIIAISFGAYYLVEPYLQKMLDMYSQLNTTVNNVQNVGNQVNSVTASSTDFLKKMEGLLNNLGK